MKAKVLKDFDALLDALRNCEHLAPKHAAARHQPRAEAAVMPPLFADEVGPVTPLVKPNRAESVRPKLKPKPRVGKAQRCTVSRAASSARTAAAPSRCTDQSDT